MHAPLALVLCKDLKHAVCEDAVVLAVRVWVHLNDVVVSRRQVRRDVPLQVRAEQRDLCMCKCKCPQHDAMQGVLSKRAMSNTRCSRGTRIVCSPPRDVACSDARTCGSCTQCHAHPSLSAMFQRQYKSPISRSTQVLSHAVPLWPHAWAPACSAAHPPALQPKSTLPYAMRLCTPPRRPP
jgi:hypothetical protein